MCFDRICGVLRYFDHTGGCVSRSGLAYPAVISRDLNIDFINLGSSGYGKGEQCIARAISEIDTPCYILDYGTNNKSAEDLEDVYLPQRGTL